ncbi:hypothetical protein OPV22_010127 [Ensete ventricosum]|uniref:Tobamovirus multiplication protein 2A n=1 Tax=Ensete ventricosum TaxID=4639 RepID=A0AAV8RCN7_ENSVE|nr:hypothetical protein OPV22_010127 [Ensete ventricosum]
MACKGFWECLLKLLNFLLTLSGLAMVGYGVYLLIECNKVSSGGDGDDEAAPTSYDPKFWMIGRPMLLFFRVFSIISPKLGSFICLLVLWLSSLSYRALGALEQ